MIAPAQRTRIRRPLYAIAALEKPAAFGFAFYKSNAPDGALRSGKPFVCVDSYGGVKFYTSSEALHEIEALLRLGWKDTLDPGYD